MDIIIQKKTINEKIMPQGPNSELFLKGIINEVGEVRHEIRNGNQIYLEDELGDILRDFLSLVYHLQTKGKISSRENVLERSLIKYKQRINGQLNGKTRNEIKIEQKKQREQEYQKHLIEEE